MARQTLIIPRTCQICGKRYDLTKEGKSAVCEACWTAIHPQEAS